MHRRGLTFIEIIAGLAIAAILAVAFYATVGTTDQTSAGADQAERASKAAVSLYDIATAIAALETTNPAVSYLQTVGAYPSVLSQLSVPITTADRNSCDRVADAYSGAAIPGGGVAYPGYVLGWKGPYYIITFAAGASTQLAPGFVTQDDMVRTPANTGNNPPANALAGRLAIRMPSVTQSDAQALDAAVDRTISGTSGTVRYTASDPTVVDYELRVAGC